MKHLKTILLFLYVAVILVMAAATIVEKYNGTAYVGEYWYGSWWFSVLWALLAAVGIVWFLKQRVRKVFVVVLHLSFIVILAGSSTSSMLLSNTLRFISKVSPSS